MQSKQKNIFLIGFMGSGKSTVGKLLAKKLCLSFIDTDIEIERRCGVSISEIFEIEGEAGFRIREAKLINEISKKSGFVVATGGGVITIEENRVNLKKESIVIYLKSSPDNLWLRTKNNPKRPLLNTDEPKKNLEILLKKRNNLYEGVADLIVETGKPRASATVNEILDKLTQRNLFF